jgi:cytochrome c556
MIWENEQASFIQIDELSQCAKAAVTTLLRAAMIATIVMVSAAIAVAMSGAVGDRQASMKAMATAVKTIDSMFKDPSVYSAGKLKQAAETISRNSGTALGSHFPDPVVVDGSYASAEISTNRDHFDQLASDLKSYADLISTAADKNPRGMSPEMRMKPGEAMGGGPLGVHVENKAKSASLPAEHAFHLMIQTCTTCHARFRVTK